MSNDPSATVRKDARIDWPSIHRHLEAFGDSLAKGYSPDDDEVRAILKARARSLAMRPEQAEGEEARIPVLEFLLAGETYAIETSFVRETFPLAEFTPLPCTPSFVLGIIHLRGRILSIIDLRRFFELPGTSLSNLNRVIVVSDGKMEFGLLADSIEEMRPLPLRELQPPLPTMTGIREEFLRGVTGGRLALLDMGKILADRRLVVHEEVE